MTTEPRFNPPSTAQISGNAGRLVAMSAIFLAGVLSLANPARAQGAGSDDENVEVMTRGPVHEAFASVVDYNPGRGLVTKKRPPDPIEELPPEERPEGEDVAWIPGYWAWDDEQTDYIWVSGTWRVPPPGREWVPGYWADSDGEFIWISGYWGEIEVRQTTYLPPPPRSLESGPNIEPPSADYGWTPGCWVWYEGSYAWRPGYWAEGRGDWVWIPSYYVWTPHGYIFIDGYWDYVIARRGIVYAPVYFRSRAYTRRGYFYSPRIVFNLGIFSDHLFLRPRWSHYYFGDYYDPRYESAGFYFTFSYYYGWRGYDPFYSYWRWENRRERDWESRYQASYRYRRENVAARPPSTWSAQVAVATSTTTSTESRIIVAGTTSQLTSTKDFSPKFRRVSEDERRGMANRGQEVRASREQRRNLEVRAAGATAGTTGAVAKPEKLERPKSAIAAKSTRQAPKELVPPKAQKAPKPDPKVKSAPGAAADKSQDKARSKDVEPRSNRPAEARPQKTDGAQDREPKVGREAVERENAAKSKAPGEAQARAKQQADESERAAKAKSQQQAPEKAAEAQRRKDEQAAARRAQESETRARNEAQAREKREAEQRAKAAQAKAKAEANQRAKEASAQKAKGSQKQEKGKSNEDEEDSSKKKQGNGRP